MKKLYTLLIALLAINTAMAQGCLQEGITFTTQEQIDNFQTDYPGCEEIEGDVILTGENITNLNGLNILNLIGGDFLVYSTSLINFSGLNALTIVDGIFWVIWNDVLIDFSGIGNLNYVGEAFYIGANTNLKKLTGLEGLTSIGGNFSIGTYGNGGNQSLNSLSGLVNLSLIEGELRIYNNDSLTNLNGLESLTNIEGDFWLENNDYLIDLFGLSGLVNISGSLYLGGPYGGNSSMVSLIGLDNLTTVKNHFLIYSNISLTNIASLNNLTSIGGNFKISYNNSLNDLIGIENIDAQSISDLNITYNYLLSECEVKSICDYLSEPQGTIVINDNAPGCNSREEIEAACLVGLENIIQENKLSIFPNPSSSRFTIQFNLENEEQVKLLVLNKLGQVLATLTNETLSEGQHELNWNAEGMPAGVYFYNIQIGKQAGTGKLVLMK